MKFILFLLLVTVPIIVFGQSSVPVKSNVSGLWADSTGSSFSNCTLIIAQEGTRIHLAHYLEWNGTPFVEYGVGTRGGDTLSYHVTVTRPIPGWAQSGDHSVVLSPDGMTLRGSYTDEKGNTGPIVFKRVGK